jgi:hypothetical protein
LWRRRLCAAELSNENVNVNRHSAKASEIARHIFFQFISLAPLNRVVEFTWRFLMPTTGAMAKFILRKHGEGVKEASSSRVSHMHHAQDARATSDRLGFAGTWDYSYPTPAPFRDPCVS